MAANPTIVIQPPAGEVKWMKLKSKILRSPMTISSCSNHPKYNKNAVNKNNSDRISSIPQHTALPRPTTTDISKHRNMSTPRRHTTGTGSGMHFRRNSDLHHIRLVVKSCEEPGMLGNGEVVDRNISKAKAKRHVISGLELVHRLFQIWQPQLAKSWRPAAKPEIPISVRSYTSSAMSRPVTPKLA